MSTVYAWDELKKVVVLDHAINAIQAKLAKTHKKLRDETERSEKQKTLVNQTELSARSLHKEMDKCELAIKADRLALTRKEQQLSFLSNAKERSALEHEIAKMRAEIDAKEDFLLTLFDQQEVVKESLKNQQEALASAVAALEAQTTSIHAEITALQAELTAQEREWNVLLEAVPEKMRVHYLQLRSRLKNAAAPVASDACTACFIELLPQELARLTPRSVIQCRNCYRFLYREDATTSVLTETL